MPDPAWNGSVQSDRGAEIDDDIVIGAEAIARDVFEGRLNRRQVYLLAAAPGEDQPGPAWEQSSTRCFGSTAGMPPSVAEQT